jgi:hypothetical protein
MNDIHKEAIIKSVRDIRIENNVLLDDVTDVCLNGDFDGKTDRDVIWVTVYLGNEDCIEMAISFIRYRKNLEDIIKERRDSIMENLGI